MVMAGSFRVAFPNSRRLIDSNLDDADKEQNHDDDDDHADDSDATTSRVHLNSRLTGDLGLFRP
jgi:hypothetical protein